MKQSIVRRVSVLVVCTCSVFIMMLFTACAGVNTGTGSTGGTNSIALTGTVQSVNTQAGTVTLAVNGQTYTIGGLSSADLANLQQHLNKTFTIQAAQNGSSYTIVANTSPVEKDNAPQGTTVAPTQQNQNNSTNQPGNLSFIGKVQSSDANNVTVLMPNNDTLSMSINSLTKRSDFPGQIPSGRQIKVSAVANTDGSFTAKELKAVDQKDLQDTQKLSEVDFQAVVTSAVGTNNVIHFQVGNKSYSVTANGATQVKGFTSLQAIPANQSVKLNIQYNGSNGNLIKVDNGND